jgi:UDP-glucuronate 4-epimerase
MVNPKKILITGVAGFIGFHLAKYLIKKNYKVIGLDNLNNYYSPSLKKDRIKILKKISKKNFNFFKINISNHKSFYNLPKFEINYIFHLAAQAGVRYSLENPQKFIDSNITGFLNVINFAKTRKIKKIFCASSSSIYGLSNKFPYKENHNTDNVLQFYAVTKKTNELMSHVYSNLNNLSIICGRFFTVYGPMGRPDMAIYKFALNILNKKKIQIYNNGNHFRDFTYIDDLIIVLFKIMKKHLSIKKDKYFNILNISSGKRGNILKILKLLEFNLKKKAKVNLINKQKGDMLGTCGSTIKLKKFILYVPKISYKTGIFLFVNWLKKYHLKKYENK